MRKMLKQLHLSNEIMRAMQADDMLSPQRSFRQSIRNHSTPLNANGPRSSNSTITSNKNRKKKRKLVHISPEVIDLTPKKPRLSSNDSDVEFIEPEPPTIIDLVADETYNCNALTEVNATADTATISESRTNENSNLSVNNDSLVTNHTPESTELVDGTSTEAPKVPVPSSIEPVPLYVKDSSGGLSLKPPLYDLVSDDSFCFDSPSATPKSSQDFSQNYSRNETLTNVDDSVIFVSETMNTPKNVRRALPRAEDFISINNRGGFNRLQRKDRSSPRAKAQKRRSPKKVQTNDVIKNTQPQTGSTPKPISGVKRMVLIDGNNVAFSHTRNREFSVEGINICLNYFLEKGYDAKAIVPQMRLKKTKSSNQDLLAQLESEGKVVFSPCKNLPNGQKVTSYDDRFILDFAADYDAAVISNDNYRDLSKESERYRDIINTRVIGFTFLNDIIRFPQDPYGKFGPSLDDILNGKETK